MSIVTEQFTRASTASDQPSLARARVAAEPQRTDLHAVAEHMFALMLRNIASEGFVFSDPAEPGNFSRPGCVIAAPSFPANTPGINQNYVYNWTRDAAITALEVAAAGMPALGGAVQPLVDYVDFAALCQGNAAPTLGHACFTIDGRSRPWSEQNDGPAVQTIAMLAAFDQLDDAARVTATAVMARNVEFLLSVHRDATTNLWEEHSGYSFFARAVQLRCFRELTSNTHGIPVPQGIAGAIDWLENALHEHWNGTHYVTMIGPPVPPEQGYDPNIDIVQASVYGAIPCTDTKLLATAAQLRRQWAGADSPSVYPINLADQSLGIGPLLGRYPGDTYDGDTSDNVAGGHPWALCTCNFAELYHTLANAIAQGQPVPVDDLSQEFFAQVGVTAATPSGDVVTSLRGAADAMLQAVIYHSDHFELSEQFDGTTGFEKSVRDLTWSYASFLSAVRARGNGGV